MSVVDELIEVLQEYMEYRPAFRNRPLGMPDSPARVRQNIEIDLEDKARAVIARAKQQQR